MKTPNPKQMPDEQANQVPLGHERNCAAWISDQGHEVNGTDCTCGLYWRKQIAQLRADLKSAQEARDALLAEVSRARHLLYRVEGLDAMAAYSILAHLTTDLPKPFGLPAIHREPKGEEQILTAEQVLLESDEYCATKGNSKLGAVMRRHYEAYKEMAPAVMTSLRLEKVTMYRRKTEAPKPAPPEAPEAK